MATRSRIAIENQDETITSIYCHFDGYLEGVGKKLFEHYDREKTEKLIELGNISVLGESTLNTIAYHRDRGEDFNRTIYIDLEEFIDMNQGGGVDYLYVLTKDDIWLVNKTTSVHTRYLKEELEEEGI